MADDRGPHGNKIFSSRPVDESEDDGNMERHGSMVLLSDCASANCNTGDTEKSGGADGIVARPSEQDQGANGIHTTADSLCGGRGGNRRAPTACGRRCAVARVWRL